MSRKREMRAACSRAAVIWSSQRVSRVAFTSSVLGSCICVSGCRVARSIEVSIRRSRNDLPLHGGNVLPTELLAGAESPLARDQLVARPASIGAAYDDGLQEPDLFDRRYELVERSRVDGLSGLERIGFDVLDGQLDQAAFALGLFARRPEESLEPSAEATSSSGGFRHAGTSGGTGGGSDSIAGRLGDGGTSCSTRRISS